MKGGRKKFKVGAIVGLKSGGSEMVIGDMPTTASEMMGLENADPSLVFCQWHDSYGRACSEKYNFLNLILIDDG